MLLKTSLKKYGMVLVLIVAILFFSILAPNFFSLKNFMNIARQVSMMGIVTVGMTFLMLTGAVDLSVGSQMSCINIICAWLLVNGGVPTIPAILLGMLAGTFIGVINGLIIVKSGMVPLVVTLAMMQVFKGVALIICGGLPIFGFPSDFSILGQGYIGFIPIPVIIFSIVLILASIFLNKTYIGRYFYAIGGNAEAAHLSGINIHRFKILVFGICGFLTGLASVIMLSRVNSGQAVTGSGLEFDVLTAAILGGVSMNGGKGKIFGMLIGVLFMGILNNGLTLLNVNEYVQYVIKGLSLLIAVWYDTKQQGDKSFIKSFIRRVTAKA